MRQISRKCNARADPQSIDIYDARHVAAPRLAALAACLDPFHNQITGKPRSDHRTGSLSSIVSSRYLIALAVARQVLPGGRVMRIRKLLLGACLCMGTMLPGVVRADEMVTTANVNLRSGAGVEHSRIVTLPQGRLVRVRTCRNDWCRISVEDLTGWISIRYLTAPGSIEPYYPQTVVPPPPVKIRPAVPRNYHELGSPRLHEPRRKFQEYPSRGR